MDMEDQFQPQQLDFTQDSELAVTVFDNVQSVGRMEEPTPLCTLPPNPVLCVSDWVFKKVEEMQSVFGFSYIGFEDQVRALLIAIENNRSKSTTKRERRLKRLSCSMNYEVKEWGSEEID